MDVWSLDRPLSWPHRDSLKTPPDSAAAVDRARLLAPGLWMMTLAPLVVAVRAALALVGASEPDFYWVFFAVGGTLSGLGMILAAVATPRTPPFWWVVSGAAIALVGHNLVPRVPQEPLALAGPSLVHLGTAILLWPWARPALAAGLLAALGAYLRWDHPIVGGALLLSGALGLFAALLCTALWHRQPADR